MAYIRQRIDPGARSRATTSYAAIASGLSRSGLALPLAGVLYERLHGRRLLGHGGHRSYRPARHAGSA